MKYASICILVIMACGLVISGCADKNDTASEAPSSQISLTNNTAAADAILSEGNVSITDTEIRLWTGNERLEALFEMEKRCTLLSKYLMASPLFSVNLYIYSEQISFYRWTYIYYM